MDISNITPSIIAGLVSSVITEAFKLFPVLSKTEERKKILTFIITFVVSGVFILANGNIANRTVFVANTLATTFLVYKTLIQPIEIIGKSSVKRIRKRRKTNTNSLSQKEK